MKFISNNNITDPTLNLAMEEYVLKNLPAEESYFLFYINRPSIIVGKNQNTIEEVNQTYIDAHNIHPMQSTHQKNFLWLRCLS